MTLLQPSAAVGGENWWDVAGETCVAVYAPVLAESLETSYVNLANPGTNNAAAGTAPVLIPGLGWLFDGASTFLTTGLNVSGGAYSLFAYVAGASGTGFAVSAGGGANNSVYLKPVASLGAHGFANGGANTGTTEVESGVMAVAGPKGYVNGVETSTLGAWSGGDANNLYIGATYDGLGTSSYYEGAIAVVLVYSTTLNTTQVAALTAAIEALLE